MHHPTDRVAHTTAFVTPVVEHWLEQEIAQWVHHEGSIQHFCLELTDLPVSNLYGMLLRFCSFCVCFFIIVSHVL